MKNIKHSVARWFLIIAIVFLTVETIIPQRTRAQMVVTDPGNTIQGVLDVAQNTISAVANVASKIYDAYINQKETVLDPLAWMLAKQLLQSITADVVDWINGGFNGNPAFMSHPEAFFLDVADQTTGAFIANSGPLSSLCSPFSLDIRLALGLRMAQSQSSRKRYACTLNTIINNVKNIPNGITVNGSSINGFMNGDFSQGGWPAFISMTTEPQNNIYGAYLTAQSDLQAQIGSKQASINADLSMGGGFMSFKKCETLGTVVGGYAGVTSDETSKWESDPTVTTKVNSNGSVTYQRCHTETPGSVISGALNKQLGTGSDSLVAADEIDEIISAAFNQLLKKVLTGGLLSSSQSGSSGATQSVINNLRTDTTGLPIEATSRGILNSVNEYLSITQQYKSYRDQTVSEIVPLKTYTDSLVQTCRDSSSAETIRNIRDIQLTPMLSTYQNKADEANTRLQILNDIKTRVTNTTDPQTIASLGRQLSDMFASSNITTEIDIQNAKDDLETVKTTVSDIQRSVSRYENSCQQNRANHN